jgi:antitoxin (DNA-binding transcriptional repressor) of toxin-antitoxin stability system
MVLVTLEHAQNHLADLIQQVQSGEDVVIEESGMPLAQLSRPSLPPTGPAKHGPRTPGFISDAGFYMAEDFDAPLEEFREYM